MMSAGFFTGFVRADGRAPCNVREMVSAQTRSNSRADSTVSVVASASMPFHKPRAPRNRPRTMRIASVLAVLMTSASVVVKADEALTQSGLRTWVDPMTPRDAFGYTSSRGEKWDLVMSDEFDVSERSFLPGGDHVWTAIDAPDGTSASLAYYAKERATTECQDNGACYLKLEAVVTPRSVRVWNANTSSLQNVTFQYQSAMLQSWNKFCFQGGLVEVRAKLPSITVQNPDIAAGSTTRIKTSTFYPTWPGVWLMGNLGRALFRDSLDRMWPFSYDKCQSDIVDPANQRVSACNDEPGSGLNPNQGRGAPQVDVFQASGLQIASTLHIGPGMPTPFRRIPGENATCAYTAGCKTQGANVVGVPKPAYDYRNYKSWYQGLRYASNPLCAIDDKVPRQTYDAIQAALNAGIYSNTCDMTHCPASFDINSDLSLIGASSTYGARWGINTDGSCFAQMSPYDGDVQCDRSSRDASCAKPPTTTAQVPSKNTTSFQYRADAVSAEWPAHVGLFTDFMTYQVEWVPGDDGYIRWMLDSHPIFEIAAATLTNPPQDDGKKNPPKKLPEEPMYLILNLALSSPTTTEPPIVPRVCGSQAMTTPNATACAQFPLSLKIDYVRVYQDLSSSSSMRVGCDPASHPTKQWIQDHIREYEDAANPVVPVVGKAFCSSDEDCTMAGQAIGACTNGRCVCSDSNWFGPRCTMSASAAAASATSTPVTTAQPSDNSGNGGGGPEITLGVGIAVVLIVLFVIIAIGRQVQRCTLFRKMRPTSHNVHALGFEPSSSLRIYEHPSPRLNASAYMMHGPYVPHQTPTIDEDNESDDRPNFVVHL